MIRKVDSCIRRCLSGAGWVAVGDAAAAYDPLQGNGVCRGLSKGLAIGRLVSGNSDVEVALQIYVDPIGRIFPSMWMRVYGEGNRFGPVGAGGSRRTRSICSGNLASRRPSIDRSTPLSRRDVAMDVWHGDLTSRSSTPSTSHAASRTVKMPSPARTSSSSAGHDPIYWTPMR